MPVPAPYIALAAVCTGFLLLDTLPRRLVRRLDSAAQTLRDYVAELRAFAEANPLSKAETAELWDLTQKLVRKKLRAPASAVFPPISEASITAAPEDYRHIEAWVDSYTPSGMPMRRSVIAILRRTQSGLQVVRLDVRKK